MERAAVITGASRGLGLALTRRFLEEGWRVFGISRTERHWKTALKALPSGEKVSFHRLDLTSELQVKRFARQILRGQAMGYCLSPDKRESKSTQIDLLINNAGYGGKLLRLENTPAAGYHKIMSGNLFSTFLMCKYFIPGFREQKKGMILNISSMAGQRAVPRVAVYSASKFGVIALSQAIAKENADTGLKCVTVCPGGMNTEMRAGLFGRKDALKQQTPEFVAGVIFDVYQDKIKVESGGDIVIRHGKITAIHPCPGA